MGILCACKQRKNGGWRGGWPHLANVYTVRECSGTTSLPSSAASARLSAWKTMEKEQNIHKKSNKYETLSVAKNIKGMHAK